MDTLLKQARLRRGLKQSEVAEAVGICNTRLSRMERRTKGVSRKMATRLAAFFPELTREQLLYPEEFEAPPARIPAQSVSAQQALEA